MFSPHILPYNFIDCQKYVKSTHRTLLSGGNMEVINWTIYAKSQDFTRKQDLDHFVSEHLSPHARLGNCGETTLWMDRYIEIIVD